MKTLLKKDLFILICLFIIMIIASCGPKPQEIHSSKTIGVQWTNENGSTYEELFDVVTIDSCEYLVGNYDRSRFITHKGNCKFCAKRNH